MRTSAIRHCFFCVSLFKCAHYHSRSCFSLSLSLLLVLQSLIIAIISVSVIHYQYYSTSFMVMIVLVVIPVIPLRWQFRCGVRRCIHAPARHPFPLRSPHSAMVHGRNNATLLPPGRLVHTRYRRGADAALTRLSSLDMRHSRGGNDTALTRCHSRGAHAAGSARAARSW